MAIKLYMGYLGSGKTLSSVREMYLSPLATYTNIKTKAGLKTNLIKRDHIIKENVEREKKKRDGTIEEIKSWEVNYEFWENAKKKNPYGFNIIIDEAHSIIDSRNAMSKFNRAAKRWASSLRKIISSKEGSGDVIFISQLPRGIDVWVKELCTQYRWHVYIAQRQCKLCSQIFLFNSSSEEPQERCPLCDVGSYNEINSVLYSFRFKTIEDVELFLMTGAKTYYYAEQINNPMQYYRYYDTFQIENLFE